MVLGVDSVGWFSVCVRWLVAGVCLIDSFSVLAVGWFRASICFVLSVFVPLLSGVGYVDRFRLD